MQGLSIAGRMRVQGVHCRKHVQMLGLQNADRTSFLPAHVLPLTPPPATGGSSPSSL